MRFWARVTIACVLVCGSLSCSGGSGGGGGCGGNPPPPSPSTVNVLTYHNDHTRTGLNPNETVLTPASVNSSNFGKRGFLAVQGKVDGEPLYVSNLSVNGAAHNVVFVVTEHDLVYAFDADGLSQLWQASVTGTGETPSDDRNCNQITPEIGITDTPVIDPSAGAHGAIYLVAMTKDGAGNYHHRLHALDLSTGAELFGGPTEVQASYPKQGGTTVFDPKQYAERQSLLLVNGTLYLGWTSHCDNQPYTGWVMAYSASTLQQTSVLDITPNGGGGSMWMAGAGMAADAAGNIYYLSGNGTFDATLDANGFPINRDYANSFLKLSGGGLAVADYFTMSNTVAESNADVDLGSGGVLLLPDLVDAGNTIRHLALGAGKDGNIYIVNRDAMGKFNPANDNAIYQEIDGALPNGEWAMPAYFNNTVYYGGVGDHLRAFPISAAKLATTPSSLSTASYNYPGTTPSVSANGAANGIVWTVQNSGGGQGVLHAYDATDLSKELYNSAQAAGSCDQFSDNKFITPMIANGKVYVGTPTGVAVFGLLH